MQPYSRAFCGTLSGIPQAYSDKYEDTSRKLLEFLCFDVQIVNEPKNSLQQQPSVASRARGAETTSRGIYQFNIQERARVGLQAFIRLFSFWSNWWAAKDESETKPNTCIKLKPEETAKY